MKFELLTTFLEVSRTLHFRVASENLFITQSAVSARIKLLEDDLGVLLFDRSHKHLKLTREGHRLIKHANELLFMWQKTKHDVGVAEHDAMQLAIGSMNSIWDIVLQGWLQKIHRNLDTVSLFTSTYSPMELRKNVINRTVDIAFLFEPPFIEDLVTEKVSTVPLHLVTTDPDHEDGMNAEDYIMVDYGESVNTLHMRESQNAPPAKHFMSQPRIALNYILQAGGSAHLPRQMIFEHVEAHNLFVVESAPVYHREIFAVYLAKSQKTEVIKQVIGLFPQLAV
ncbi:MULTISPECIES: LysR family transcriptional regulator [unclassified Colwellia]|jgi:DNA-binding transcriptional LysR family regulator|uniref:LysR family transcriptional regulator n=1 Tax=unclassified Colwellia TaxID=196834 RepID=UPI000D34B796|nr:MULTISPECIES: LysR family transcriptional regulator [unclassified Colwellia]AWB57551.1 LysR family transcriptional regulator [Colwellia sp. Arc7-D]MBA6417813.1 LysR family transcriptional regulator [Colwellia sp. 6M3]